MLRCPQLEARRYSLRLLTRTFAAGAGRIPRRFFTSQTGRRRRQLSLEPDRYSYIIPADRREPAQSRLCSSSWSLRSSFSSFSRVRASTRD